MKRELEKSTGFISYITNALSSALGYFQQSNTVEIQGELPMAAVNYLPNEIWGKILSLSLFSQENPRTWMFLSKEFYTAVIAFYRQHALPPSKQENQVFSEQDVKDFMFNCKNIRLTYPPEMIIAFNGANTIASMPTIENTDETEGKMLPYGHCESLQKVNEYYSMKLGTINLYAKIIEAEGLQEIKPIYIGSTESRCFEGMVLFYHKTDILPYEPEIFSPNKSTTYTPTLEYLGRLVRKEPCGKVVNGLETEPKVDDQNHSIVQLCDKNGNDIELYNSQNPRHPLLH